MKICKLIACLLGFVLAFMVAATAADAPPPLTFTFKKFTVPGATDTNAGGINNKGVVVGQYTDKNLVLHGFILNGKKLTKLDDPNGTSGTTGASNLALDGAIAVVGTYTSSKSGNPTGYLYKGGKFTDIPGPTGALASIANAINDAGNIVGAYVDSSGVQHGFVLKGTKYTTLDPPGATAPQGTGINKKGAIVLAWTDSGGLLESSLYNGKTYKTINVPGAAQSFVTDINNLGDITYQAVDSAGVSHGALFHKGKYYTFDYPKSAFTFAGAANDHSTIVGSWRTTSSGSNIGYTATFK
jgi:uncharacterized membrane protein